MDKRLEVYDTVSDLVIADYGTFGSSLPVNGVTGNMANPTLLISLPTEQQENLSSYPKKIRNITIIHSNHTIFRSYPPHLYPSTPSIYAGYIRNTSNKTDSICSYFHFYHYLRFCSHCFNITYHDNRSFQRKVASIH